MKKRDVQLEGGLGRFIWLVAASSLITIVVALFISTQLHAAFATLRMPGIIGFVITTATCGLVGRLIGEGAVRWGMERDVENHKDPHPG
jgi:hypothetical protein